MFGGEGCDCDVLTPNVLEVLVLLSTFSKRHFFIG